MLQEEMTFTSREAFRSWLAENHHSSPGVWLVFGKGGGRVTLKADEALEEALCFGWIDGQIQSVDEDHYLKKFTPRRKDSAWSEKNRGLAAQLIEKGLMTAAGLAAIAQAKARGCWETPQREPVTDAQVEVLVQALAGAEPALSNFLKMPPSVRRTYTALYLDAKKEDTRQARLRKIIERLNENKKPM